MQQWTGTREAAERDYFYQKGVLFAGLLDLTVTEPTRTRTIRAFATSGSFSRIASSS